jgi:hypothetical protein
MITETQSHRRKIDIVSPAFILAFGSFLRTPPHTFSQGELLHSVAPFIRS